MNYDVIKLTNENLDYIYDCIKGHTNPPDVLHQLPLPKITLELHATTEDGEEYIQTENFTFDEETATLVVRHDSFNLRGKKQDLVFRVHAVQRDDGLIEFSKPQIPANTPKELAGFLFESVEFNPSGESDVRTGHIYMGYVSRFFNINTFVRELTPELILNSTIRHSEQGGKSGHSKKKSKKPNKIKVYKVYTLVDNFEDIVREHRHNIMTCPAWGVRGHYRHYKDGRIVWVKAYVKGRDKEKYQGKEYILSPDVI